MNVKEDEKTGMENTMQPLDNLADMLRTAIHTATGELKEQFAKVIEQQEATIQKQHLTISKFQEDLLYKIQKPLIMEIIGIADNIRMMLQAQEGERNYDQLLDDVKHLEQWVEATLSNNSVRVFRETENSATELNRKRQEVIDMEETENPEKDNTYVSERPGYVWTMPYLVVNSDIQLEKVIQENAQPQMFSYVIRPEEVIKLKYKNKTTR